MNICLVCGEKNFVYKSYGRYFNLIPEDSKIQICTTCGFGKVEPLPNHKFLIQHYENDEYLRWIRHYDCKYKLDPLPNLRALNQYDFLVPHFNFKNTNNMLDFGAGSSNLMRTIKLKNPHIGTTAIELSKAYRALLGECKEITCGTYKEIPHSLSLQDLVSSTETLEHLTNPITVIEKFRSILTKEGFLFIEVPHCPFPYYYEHKKNHCPHLFFFTKSSFVQIAENCGFEIVVMESLGMSIATWSEIKNVHKKIKQEGFSYKSNENGIFLRVLLRKSK